VRDLHKRIFAEIRQSVPGLQPRLLLLAVVAFGCDTSSRQLPDRTPRPHPAAMLVETDSVEHLDVLAREPMIVQHPDGALFVTGYGEPVPTLWKSADEGKTWSRLHVGTQREGAIGNSDGDLAVSRDGTVYFVAMVYDQKAQEGRSISVGVSTDGGERWVWTLLSNDRLDDRPWVEVARNGTAHVIWNDGSGISHAVSTNGGASWTERPRIHPQGGSSHLAVGPNGEVAVRITPLSASGLKIHEGVDLVAVSTDDGLTWQKHPAPGERHWVSPAKVTANDTYRWVEPVAWDASGALYSLWANRKGVWLARSMNRGQSWVQWQIDGRADAFFPYLAARRSGEMAATWFSGAFSTLQAHVAALQITNDDRKPQVIGPLAVHPDTWERGVASEVASVPGDPAGEYLPVMFLKDDLAVVAPIQNERKKRFGFAFWRFGRREQ